MPDVVLENVSRHFGSVRAVDALNLTIRDGEFVTLLGASGCGKTTTLRMVAGLEHNTGGCIRIGGRIVSDAERGYFVPPDRRELGMVFQSYAIWPHMTVFENVAYPLRVRRRPVDQMKQQVTEALRLVEMDHLADRPAPALSGGQQQRVAIARALVFSPQVLLLDEPLSNLDARLRTQMGDEFRALQRRLGITSLYVTHDQQEALSLSDTVVVMHAGCILQSGSPEEIYLRPLSRQVAAFFGSGNLLEARVAGCQSLEDGTWRCDVVGEGWSGACATAGTLQEGRKVLVVVRPENVRLADAVPRDTAVLAWRSRVRQCDFRGKHRSVILESGPLAITAEVRAGIVVRTGDTVCAVAEMGSAWAIAE